MIDKGVVDQRLAKIRENIDLLKGLRSLTQEQLISDKGAVAQAERWIQSDFDQFADYVAAFIERQKATGKVM